MLKDWTKFEKILYISSITLIMITSILCKSNLLTIASSILGVSCAITQAKGKVISQFIGVILVAVYSILAYKNKYYGEVLIYVFIMLPLFLSGIISWLKNIDEETNIVEKNNITKKEWIILTIISTILFICLYSVLKYFNTEQVLVSTLSMVTSLFATYLVARRSKYGFIFYMGNDIIFFILWVIPVMAGNLVLAPMLCNPIINLINDTYGWKSWNKGE